MSSIFLKLFLFGENWVWGMLMILFNIFLCLKNWELGLVGVVKFVVEVVEC